MAYKCEEEVTVMAEQFILILKQSNLHAEVIQIRDYMIKLKVLKDASESMHFMIYYSPNKNKYTVKNEKATSDKFQEGVQRLWDRFTGMEIAEGIIEAEPVSQEETKEPEIDYYFRILKPYEHEQFDYIQLAQLLESYFPFDVIVYRYDYKKLERLYDEVKKR